MLIISDNNPFPMLDLTSISFVISGVLIAWVINYHRFLDIIPIARDTTIDNMQDGIVVVDLKDRVVDINPAAERIIQNSFKKVLGQPSTQIFPELTERTQQ